MQALENVDKRIEEILEESERLDDEEDKLYGDARGDEMPKELADAHRRKELLEKAKKQLDETGQETVCATDLESRVMKTRHGNRPAYNAQAVVDRENQIIVAAQIAQYEADNHQLPGMMDEVKELTGRKPGCVTVDGGYFSQETLEYAFEHEMDIYVPDNSHEQSGKEGFTYNSESDEYICPLGQRLKFSSIREKKGKTYHIYRRGCATCENRASCCGAKSRAKQIWRRIDGELQEKMHEKMQTEEAKEIYRLRKEIVEPVFGDIKENKKLRRLLLRGKLGTEKRAEAYNCETGAREPISRAIKNWLLGTRYSLLIRVSDLLEGLRCC